MLNIFDKENDENLNIIHSDSVELDTNDINIRLAYLEFEEIEIPDEIDSSSQELPEEPVKPMKPELSRPGQAILTIESIPTGSKINIKNKKGTIVARGKTPFTKRLKPGTYEVHTISVGYMSNTKRIKLTSPKNYTFTIEHQIIPIKVAIKTDPEDAYVYVNGSKERGATPLKITLRKEGPYEIEIKKKGYQDIQRTIDLRPGMIQNITINEKLKGKPINVTFRLQKKGKVIIDGKLINDDWQKRIAVKGITVGPHNIIINYKSGNQKINYDRFLIKHIDGWIYDF